MPQFTQWNVPDPTPNVMYNQAAIDQAANTTIEGRQKIGATDMEVVGRAAGSLLGMSEEDAAAAYPGMLANLQRNGFAMKAPPTYPGHAAVQNIVNSAIPIQQQIEYGILTPPGLTDAIKKSNDLLYPNSNTTSGGGGGGGGSASGDSTTETADDLTRAAAVRDGLVKRGLPLDSATAFAANALHESKANPFTGAGDAGASHGIFQWNGDRLAAFRAANGGRLPEQTNLDRQLDFVVSELHGSESTALGRIMGAQGVADKAGQVSEAYLRPKDTVPEMQRRSATALRLAGAWGGQGTPGSTAPTQQAASVLNPNAGPRVANLPPTVGPAIGAAGGPNITPGMTDQAWLDEMAKRYPALAGPNDTSQRPNATVTGQADPTAPAAPSSVASRTGGADFAGPGAGPVTMGPVDVPNTLYQTGLPGVTIRGPGSGLAPPPAAAAAPPAPVTPQPAPVAQAPAASQPRTGVNSPQFQKAQELNRAAADLLSRFPKSPQAQAQANALKAQAALYMQADSVSYDPNTGIGTKAITGERVADPTEDLRLRRAKDAREEAEAKRAGLPPGYRVDDQGRAYRIDGLPPDPAVAEAAKADYDKRQREQPFQGTGTNEQNRNILIAGTKSGQTDTPEYASAYADLAAPRYNMDGSFVKPNMAAYAKPTFKPPGATEVPDYASQETPVPTILNADQGKVAAYADRIREALPTISDTSDAAMNRWQVLLGKAPVVGNSLTSPEFQMHQQAERNFINAVLRRESGAVIAENEFTQARQQYLPQPGDSPQVLAQKAANRANVLAGMTREAGPGYKPAAGAAPSMPVVKSVEDYTKIPSGAVYTDPAGHIRKKP